MGDRARSQVQGQASQFWQGRAGQGRGSRAGRDCDEARDGHLRLDPDWIGVEGHGTVALRLLIRFWGAREHRDAPTPTQRAGRRGEPPF